MQQIVDLQADHEFLSRDIALVSIARDDLQELDAAGREFNITIPLLSDPDNAVAGAYGVLRWAVPSGEPGHTFVLIGKDGRIKWTKDYGAAENGGRMYVPVAELNQELGTLLPVSN